MHQSFAVGTYVNYYWYLQVQLTTRITYMRKERNVFPNHLEHKFHDNVHPSKKESWSLRRAAQLIFLSNIMAYLSRSLAGLVEIGQMPPFWDTPVLSHKCAI